MEHDLIWPDLTWPDPVTGVLHRAADGAAGAGEGTGWPQVASGPLQEAAGGWPSGSPHSDASTPKEGLHAWVTEMPSSGKWQTESKPIPIKLPKKNT